MYHGNLSNSISRLRTVVRPGGERIPPRGPCPGLEPPARRTLVSFFRLHHPWTHADRRTPYHQDLIPFPTAGFSRLSLSARRLEPRAPATARDPSHHLPRNGITAPDPSHHPSRVPTAARHQPRRAAEAARYQSGGSGRRTPMQSPAAGRRLSLSARRLVRPGHPPRRPATSRHQARAPSGLRHTVVPHVTHDG